MNIKQFNPYLPDLKRFLQKKIKNDLWQDIYQETMCYLIANENVQIITNAKGFLLNTATFFISKELSYNKKWQMDDESEIQTKVKPQIVFDTSTGFNGFLIDDRLHNKIKNISKDLYEPLMMQVEKDMSIKQIAKELNINENTIKTRIRRAKEYLKS